MWPDTSCTRWPTYYYISSRTSAASPPRDAAGVVGMEESGGPGNADRADGRIVRQTFLWVWRFHQLHQGDVILTIAVVEPLFGREGDWDFIDDALFRCYFIGYMVTGLDYCPVVCIPRVDVDFLNRSYICWGLSSAPFPERKLHSQASKVQPAGERLWESGFRKLNSSLLK